MFNVIKLWSERLRTTMKEMSRYLRYIFNGHLMIVMIFLIGSLSFYYQQWIKTLDDQFPAALIMAVVLGLLLTYSPVYTFLLDADRVFLLPIENKLSTYFWKSGIVSFVLQAYIILMALAALMPMYVQVYGTTYKVFFYFLSSLLLLKIWNLATRWRIQYYVELNVHYVDTLIRYCLNTVFIYLLFVSANKLFLVFLSIVMIAFFYFFYKNSLKKGLKWEELIKLEHNRQTAFYRIANLFTDVPKLKDAVKRRKWLDWVASKITYKQANSELYLLTRTFLRAGDYLGLAFRLTIIGAVLIYYWEFIYGQYVFLVLFLYLTGFQLQPLKNHHRNILWNDLYPTGNDQREQAFRRILSTVLTIQSFAFSLLFLFKGEWVFTFIGIGIGLIFTFLFVRYYSVKKV